MKKKVLGLEIKKFYSRGWTTGYYHEQNEINPEISFLKDKELYELKD